MLFMIFINSSSYNVKAVDNCSTQKNFKLPQTNLIELRAVSHESLSTRNSAINDTSQ